MLGVIASDITSEDSACHLRAARKGEEFLASFEMDMNLCPGAYRLGVCLADMQDGLYVPLFGQEALTIEVISDHSTRGIVHLNHRLHVHAVAPGTETPVES